MCADNPTLPGGRARRGRRSGSSSSCSRTAAGLRRDRPRRSACPRRRSGSGCSGWSTPGVMQIVAVTDPLQVGFTRQAMIGIRVEGDLATVADELADDRRGRLRRDHRRRRSTSCVELICEDDEHLLRRAQRADPRPCPASATTETFVYLNWPSRPTPGEPDDHTPDTSVGTESDRSPPPPATTSGCTSPGCSAYDERAGAGHRARRRAVHLGHQRQAVPGRAVRAVRRAGRARPGRAGRGGRASRPASWPSSRSGRTPTPTRSSWPTGWQRSRPAT